LEGLSRVSWKLSRTVLRGAVGGNVDCLLDPKEGKPPKQPYAIELSSGSLLAFAGLWDAWKDKDGHWLQSFWIVTTEANELLAQIPHPRMPVILHARDYDRWLDREETERLPLDLLRPFEAEAMEMYKANPKVNNVRNNGPEMLRAAEQAAVDGTLPL
jgi:putative SOS response-associated peptidase YedK